MRGQMIHDSSGAKEREEALYIPPFLKAARMIQVEPLKGAFRLLGGNIIPEPRSRVTHEGMSGIKGGVVVRGGQTITLKQIIGQCVVCNGAVKGLSFFQHNGICVSLNIRLVLGSLHACQESLLKERAKGGQ